MAHRINKKVEVIKKISMVDQIAFRLREDILSSDYSPGSEFPSEKLLSERFGASKHTVRAALRELSKEGFIDIAPGRGNIVKDFRHDIGIDVFPELLTSNPDIITPDLFAIYRRFIGWLYRQILLTAASTASSDHEQKLLEIVEAFSDEMSIEEYWETHTHFYRELLHIGDNILLMMFHNSHIKMRRRILDMGLMNRTRYPPMFNQTYRKKLIRAICKNDTKTVGKLMEKMVGVLDESLKMMFNRIKKGKK